MRQYTTSEQTAKLIELGFEKPKNRLVKQRFDRSTSSWIVVGEEGNYSIGELIEMLPQKILDYYDISILSAPQYWEILYGMIGDGDMWSVEYETYSAELIDALYDMIIVLSEKGII